MEKGRVCSYKRTYILFLCIVTLYLLSSSSSSITHTQPFFGHCISDSHPCKRCNIHIIVRDPNKSYFDQHPYKKCSCLTTNRYNYILYFIFSWSFYVNLNITCRDTRISRIQWTICTYSLKLFDIFSIMYFMQPRYYYTSALNLSICWLKPGSTPKQHTNTTPCCPLGFKLTGVRHSLPYPEEK